MMETSKADMLLQQFNETIEQWIGYLDHYSLDMLRQQPDAQSWSLGQVYVHIIDDTRYYIEQMKAALLTDANGDKEMHAFARTIFDNNGFPDALLQGPSTNAAMRQPESKDELLQHLVSIKQEVNTLCTRFHIATSTGKSAHPGFYFFSAQEWLQFAEMHMRHHFRQKKRIDDKLFPPANS